MTEEHKKILLFVVIGVFVLVVIQAQETKSKKIVSRSRRVSRRTGGQGVDPHDNTLYSVASLATLGGLLV